MTDTRIPKLARIIVDHSARVKPGDRVAIETTTNAEDMARSLYELVLQRGGFPHLLLNLPDQDVLFYKYANEAQLDFTPTFQKLVTEEFDVYIRARADTNLRQLAEVEPARQQRFQKAYAPVRSAMLKRAAEKTMRWVLTQIPTQGYADEAGMPLAEYEDFLFRACHADLNTPDPVAYWQGVEQEQSQIIQRIQGGDQVRLQGPNVDLTLSIKGRTFQNSCGRHNLPDGEIYTGPVEDSVNGWVKYTYPAIYQGRAVEGIELYFDCGRVVSATAQSGQDILDAMVNLDSGSRHVGEFAIGTNFEINRFTHNILFDEKLGGTFHMALGQGYPETGSRNTSALHWDMICDMRQDAEIRVDGEVFYRDGQFV